VAKRKQLEPFVVGDSSAGDPLSDALICVSHGTAILDALTVLIEGQGAQLRETYPDTLIHCVYAAVENLRRVDRLLNQMVNEDMKRGQEIARSSRLEAANG